MPKTFYYKKKHYICIITHHKIRFWTMKVLNYLVAFLGGAAIGTACGLLFAPEKGSDLRERIAEALRKRGIKLNSKEMANLVDEIAEELQANPAPEV